MLFQREHFLLSYFKTLIVGLTGVELTTSRVIARSSTNWANGARSGDGAWGLMQKGRSLTYCAIFATYMALLPPRQGLLLVVPNVTVYDFLSCCDCPNEITPRGCVNYLAKKMWPGSKGQALLSLGLYWKACFCKEVIRTNNHLLHIQRIILARFSPLPAVFYSAKLN